MTNEENFQTYFNTLTFTHKMQKEQTEAFRELMFNFYKLGVADGFDCCYDSDKRNQTLEFLKLTSERK